MVLGSLDSFVSEDDASMGVTTEDSTNPYSLPDVPDTSASSGMSGFMGGAMNFINGFTTKLKMPTVNTNVAVQPKTIYMIGGIAAVLAIIFLSSSKKR